MNILIINFLMAMTISLAAITGAVRWQKIDPSNRPIILAWWTVVITETAQFIAISFGVYPNPIYNIYILPLLALLLFQFKEWGVLNIRWAILIFVVLSLVWVADFFIIDGYRFTARRNIYRLCFNLVMVVLAVTSINKQIMSERKVLLTNHRFLICIGLTVYYTYRVLVDAFFLKGFSNEFATYLSSFNRYLLQFYYLILFLAALWIPRKKNYILPS